MSIALQRWVVFCVLSCVFVISGAVSLPALAQVDVNIVIGVPPPPPRVEAVPGPRPGYLWAPGYWKWEHDRHVWVEGHWLAARPGYMWVPDHWESHGQAEGRHYHEISGHWEREHAHAERSHQRHEPHDDHDRH